MRVFRITSVFTVMGGMAVLAIGAAPGCSQQPVNVPIRSLERSQKMDVVCLHVVQPDPSQPYLAPQIPAEPVREENCAPVPPDLKNSGLDPATLPYHLYGLVTQSARGELAVVDLTTGLSIDVDTATPGINFIPVGSLPTDVAVATDGAMTFVASAETNKTAIYGVPSKYILGNSQVKFGLAPGLAPPAPKLTQWPACSLPQAPGAMVVVPVAAPPKSDAGTDASTGAGTGTGKDPEYVLAVVLPGGPGQSSKVVTIDPAPLLRGADLLASDGARVEPGSLAPCPILKGVEISGALPATATVGEAWSDGVPYVPGGVDLTGKLPPLPASCGSSTQGSSRQPGAPVPVATGPSTAPRGGAAARRGTLLYVADDALPLIHVFDLADPLHPKELAPLLATSVTDPQRSVSVGSLAVSPPTRDYKYFLYAIDRRSGSLMVYDVTDPETSPHVPLTRPHPELNPFSAVDRITFGAPVVAVEMVSIDWPVTGDGVSQRTAAIVGPRCNPNANAGTGNGPFKDQGANYRNYFNLDVDKSQRYLGPWRLRGVFAMATLTTGNVIMIDVDDWDAPCRRPDLYDAANQTNDVGVPVPPAKDPTGGPNDANDLDPYHAPLTFGAGGGRGTPVTLEAFFPVSSPHRTRSANWLSGVSSTGNHLPSLASTPSLSLETNTLPTVGENSTNFPALLPTRTPFLDPRYIVDSATGNPDERVITVPLSQQETAAGVSPYNAGVLLVPGVATPNVRFSLEDPTVHQSQDWFVTFEGALPTDATVPTTITPGGDDGTFTLANGSALYCRSGIEDYRLGKERAEASLRALRDLKGKLSTLVVPEDLPYRTADYVQVIDKIPASDDLYWKDAPFCADTAADPGTPASGPVIKTDPAQRYAYCETTFGDPDTPSEQRDFPILEAYEDHLLLGSYAYPDAGEAPDTRNRVVFDGKTMPYQHGDLERHQELARSYRKALQCCFGGRVSFRVRAGGQWLTTGSGSGYLHRVTADPTTRACVQSCRPEDRLKNSRVAEIPRPFDENGQPSAFPASFLVDGLPDRNSALAIRNPLLSFLVWGGARPSGFRFTTTQRNFQWKFSTANGFGVQFVSVAYQSTNVSPQSMRFINSLGQVAVVDGAAQGVSLINLESASGPATTYTTPYF